MAEFRSSTGSFANRVNIGLISSTVTGTILEAMAATAIGSGYSISVMQTVTDSCRHTLTSLRPARRSLFR